MKEFIAQNGGIVASIMIIVAAFNFTLMGIQKALELVKDKTQNAFDNKLYDFIYKVTEVLTKGIDWFSGNRAHK